ncbi:MAG: cytochrome c biogenesis protein CcsA [Fimbriimonadaceae bacterium]|nr:cytochrome c biogenesis protein CcsA [Fimbriimonadaceae bacterium]
MIDAVAAHWEVAPTWAVVVGWLGRGCVWLAAAALLVSIGGWLRAPSGERLGKVAFTVGCASLVGAFANLAALFVGNQFQFKYVHDHAARATALGYKIAGVWSGQEGSFLLWAVASAVFGLFAARRVGSEYRKWFTIPYATFLAALAGILAFESPFKPWVVEGRILDRIPPDGAGMTPALQNYWVTIHPPTIFLGFGSLTVLACWAFSAMIVRDPHSWVARVRPWALLATSVTGLGLCMGGFWAYETLGWGGFWAWDPVENVSFVPWLLAACFVHGLIAQAADRRWAATNLLFGGLPFLAFVYGTFLTRSGFLAETSVHSFARMERTAHFLLLGFFVLSSVAYLAVWFRYRTTVVQAPAPKAAGRLRREAMYRFGSFLLAGLALATAIGMSVPMIMALRGQKPKVVEEALYHQVVVWFFVPIMLLVGVAPFVSWRAMGLGALLRRLVNVLSLTFGALGFAIYFALHREWGVRADLDASVPTPFGRILLFPWMFVLVGVCLFAAIANLWRIGETWKRAKLSIGGFVAHLGLAVLMTGLIVSRGFEQRAQIFVQDGSPATGLGYLVAYKGITGDWLDRNNQVRFEVTRPDGSTFEARPGHYYVLSRQPGAEPQPMVWPHVQESLSHDMYLALHPQIIDGEASEPVTLAKGQTKVVGDYQVTYLDSQRKGEAGAAGTEFVGRFRLVGEEGQAEGEAGLKIGGPGEISRRPLLLNEHYNLVLDRLDAATGEATVQLRYVKPWFPIEIFYKPLTLLVWIGTGILTLGGLLAAWEKRRRLRARGHSPVPNHQPETDDSRPETDAAPATAQV